MTRRGRHRSYIRRERPMPSTRSRFVHARRWPTMPSRRSRARSAPWRASAALASSGSCRLTAASTSGTAAVARALRHGTPRRGALRRARSSATTRHDPSPGRAARTMDSATRTAPSQVPARPRGDHPTFSMPLGQGTEPLGSKSRAGPDAGPGRPGNGEHVGLCGGCDHRPACRENVGNHDACRLSRAWWAQQQHAVLRAGEDGSAPGPEGGPKIDAVSVQLRSRKHQSMGINGSLGHL